MARFKEDRVELLLRGAEKPKKNTAEEVPRQSVAFALAGFQRIGFVRKGMLNLVFEFPNDVECEI